MEQVPPSHFPLIASNKEDKNEKTRYEGHSAAAVPFQLAMEHVHRISSEVTKSPQQQQQYLIHGGCPFKSFHQDHSSSESSTDNFVRAMEEYSVAYIGRMVDSFGEDEQDKDHKNIIIHDGEEEHHSEKTSSLSAALKMGTAESHEAAENVHFVKNFIHGKIDRELYKDLVTGLFHIYECLETLLSIHGPKHFPSLHFAKELNRTEALKEDMEYWHGDKWETDPKCRNPSPAVKDYIDRMEQVGRMDPLLLLSHAYTRYLGDLSGGKILSRIARKALNINSFDGLQFYNFEAIPSAVAFKKMYRAALDELALKPDQMGKLVAEANVAFALNMRVFEELDVTGKVPGARLRPVREALAYYDRIIDQQKSKNGFDADKTIAEAKCPFGFKDGSPSSHKESRNPTTLTGLKIAKETTSLKEQSSRCPWPFVFFHDPITGMKDWQTWFIIGIAICWCWSQL
jgi:heme oxygenase